MNGNADDPQLLLCWHQDKLDIFMINSVPDTVRLPDGVVLVDACDQCNDAYFTGFVDYLRRSNEIVGVRYTPFGDYEYLAIEQRGHPSMEIEPSGGMLIYWSDVKTFDFDRSGDQEFGGNRIFANDGTGHRALTIKLIPEISFEGIQFGKGVTYHGQIAFDHSY